MEDLKAGTKQPKRHTGSSSSSFTAMPTPPQIPQDEMARVNNLIMLAILKASRGACGCEVSQLMKRVAEYMERAMESAL